MRRRSPTSRVVVVGEMFPYAHRGGLLAAAAGFAGGFGKLTSHLPLSPTLMRLALCHSETFEGADHAIIVTMPHLLPYRLRRMFATSRCSATTCNTFQRACWKTSRRSNPSLTSVPSLFS